MEATLAQRFDALNAANAVRTNRARLKDRVHADPSWLTLIDLVRGARTARTEASDEALIQGMRAMDLLLAAPGVGRVKARGMLSQAGAAPGGAYRELTFKELGERRRRELAVRLLRNRSTLSDTALKRIAETPRWNGAGGKAER